MPVSSPHASGSPRHDLVGLHDPPPDAAGPFSAATDERRRVAAAWRWVEEFLTRHHPQLGRDGDVCPFVTRSVSRSLLHVESFDARDGNEAMRDRVRGLRDGLLEKSASAGDSRMYLTSILIPYGQPDRIITRQIEYVQSALKPEFVSQGMMIGEFWPGHTMPGLHNQSFRPLAAPVPMLAIRYMVATDLLFLSGPHISPVTQVSLLADYERNLGLGLTARWRARCHEAMAAAARAAAREAAADATGQAT